MTRRTFRLGGGRWETPGPDDAEALVDRLVRDGVIARDPLVAAALRGATGRRSRERTLERRFRAATGLTQGAVRQIGRARAAATLLASGAAVETAVVDLGYFDEPHLARALRRYVGRTPGSCARAAAGRSPSILAQRTTS